MHILLFKNTTYFNLHCSQMIRKRAFVTVKKQPPLPLVRTQGFFYTLEQFGRKTTQYVINVCHPTGKINKDVGTAHCVGYVRKYCPNFDSKVYRKCYLHQITFLCRIFCNVYNKTFQAKNRNSFCYVVRTKGGPNRFQLKTNFKPPQSKYCRRILCRSEIYFKYLF